MQRVRIGLMGLAVVFLLVLLAAAFFGMASGGDEVARPGTGGAPTGNAAVAIDGDASPKEPLAELGVAPGGAAEIDNIAAPDQPPVIIAAPPAPVLPQRAERTVP